MENNNTVKYRLERVEKVADKNGGKLDTIMENHLPHIHQDIVRLESKITQFTAINIGAIVVGVIVSKFLK